MFTKTWLIYMAKVNKTKFKQTKCFGPKIVYASLISVIPCIVFKPIRPYPNLATKSNISDRPHN